MRSGGLPAYLSLNRLLNGSFMFPMLYCSNSTHFPEIQLVCDAPTDGRTDRRNDGPTDGQTLFQRCENASKNYKKTVTYGWRAIDGGPPFAGGGRRVILRLFSTVAAMMFVFLRLLFMRLMIGFVLFLFRFYSVRRIRFRRSVIRVQNGKRKD